MLAISKRKTKAAIKKQGGDENVTFSGGGGGGAGGDLRRCGLFRFSNWAFNVMSKG